MTMECPRTFLTLFAAVLRSAAPAALSELSRELLPFTTLVVCALPNATPRIILAAEIAHHNPSPVLHIVAVISHRKLLNQRENVEIVG